jgi:hypothetical protein
MKSALKAMSTAIMRGLAHYRMRRIAIDEWNKAPRSAPASSEAALLITC